MQLCIKRRDRPAATPIAGTTGVRSVAVSPNGEWIAFVSGGSLKKVPTAGGAPVTLVNAAVEGTLGVAWLDDGTIVFVNARAGLPALGQVSADGGTPTVAWRSDSAGGVLPAPIAGTRSILFERCTTAVTCSLWTVDLASGKSHLVIPGVTSARYAATGDLVYVQDGRLFASRFDRGALVVRGQPVLLADSISPTTRPIELSRSGTLLTRVGGSGANPGFEMVWVDRAGRVTPVDTSWQFRVTAFASDHGWALSPDGTRARHRAVHRCR